MCDMLHSICGIIFNIICAFAVGAVQQCE